jgi:hypothetical protein
MKLSAMISTNKTTGGLIATIVLVILLCQPNIFKSFTGSVLGRFVLIMLILGITHLHMIFGVIVILVIIVLLSNSGNAYLEGFEGGDASTTTTDPTTTDSTTKTAPATATTATTTTTATTATTTSPTVPPPPANPPQSGLKPAVPMSQVPPAPSSSKKETFASREGFSMTDRESNMLKGKNSKQIAVFSNARAQKNPVEPSDTSVFTSGYSSV